MPRFVTRKILRAIIVLFFVSLGVGSMFDLVPGDPATAILGRSTTPENIAQVHERLGLDRPFLERYADWAGSAVRGDLGESYGSREPVTSIVWRTLPVTLELVVLTLVFSLVVSIPLGVLAATRHGRRADRVISTVTSAMQALPAFIAVPLLVYIVVLRVGLLPATGWVPVTKSPLENLRHLVLPCFVMSFAVIPVFTAALRSDMIETLRQDFIMNARAKGLSERTVLFRHALRPSSISLFTLIGLALGQLLSSAVIVEVLFVLPGLGSMSVDAINTRDVPVVQGIVIFVAAIYILVNAAVDIGYRFLDPRVRLQAS